MQSPSQVQFSQAFSKQGHPPERRGKYASSLWPLLLVCLTAYAVSAGFRFAEYPFWDQAGLFFQGEPLMGTHDAYGWMAGAKGIGRWANHALASVLALLHAVSGLSLTTLNFWLPVFIAPLAVIPMCLLCAFWGHTEAGVVSGIIATSSLGFLLRTRMGFGDTDILTLFLPLFFITCLIWWLSPIVRSGWIRHKAGPGEHPPAHPPDRGSFASTWNRAFWVGLVFFVYMWFYPSGYPVAMYILCTAVLVLLLLKDTADWEVIWGGLAILLAFGKLGWIAFPLSFLLVGGAYLAPEMCSQKRFGLIALIIVVVLYPLLNGWSVVTQLIDPILSYAKVASSQGTEGLVQFPSVKQSIREVQNIDLSQIIFRTGIHWTIFTAGILGFLLLVWYYPPALLFCPLLFLALLSSQLGNRFSMYGGPVLGLGLGVGASIVFQKLHWPKLYRWLLHFGIAIPVVGLVWSSAQSLRPNPIIPKPYAATLSQMRNISPVHSQLWQWWDYGFAAQHYAERYSFGDGVAHYGPYLYPLALVHATSSPLQANQIMKYTALSQYRQIIKEQDPAPDFRKSTLRSLYFSKKPLSEFSKMKGEEANALIQSLAEKPRDWPSNLPPLYLTLSWENLKLAYWISAFGSWDLHSGQKGLSGNIQQIRGNVRLNMDQGILQTDNRSIRIKTLDILQKGKMLQRSWPSASGIHAVANDLAQEIYIMDSTLYESMMIQMLIKDPDQYQRYFELVIDNFPWARVYRVQ